MVRRVAYAGAIVMLGLVGCTAQATTGTPTGTPSPGGTPSASASASPSTSTTRANISVQLNPDKVTAGETSKVWILANCPVPTGGPAHSGTATSKAFLSGVSLNPVPPNTPSASPTATATATPGPVPWVRGQAQISGTVKRGTYQVDVKCDGTNDTGRATLRVVRAEEAPTGVPTKAPKAGGGGTFGKDVDEDSSIPLGPAGVLIALALAAGIGLAVKRRRA